MELVSMPYKYAFIDIKNFTNKNGFLMAGTNYYKMKANWNKVFDGLIYIKSMSPPTYTIKWNVERNDDLPHASARLQRVLP